MFLIILLLPLAGSISAGFFGWYIGNKGSTILTTFFMILASICSFYIFYDVGYLGNSCYIDLGVWIKSDLFIVNWGFLFDSLTATMCVVITTISTLVHLYSCGYMAHDPHLSRFMSYLSLFTFFMLILVTADNFIQMFLGWEGVGLCSYLLISFWFTRIQANKSALKALIVNRVGDCGLLFGICILFYYFRSVDFNIVFSLAPFFENKTMFFFNFEFNIITLACLSLFVGAVGKSAQLGLHTWLPDAMEGPTPVSALIHAATMVTAGVFIIIRCSPLFEYSSTALLVISIFGALTTFFAATIGIVQNDIKKIIAYSTCSQLGYMIFTCGLSNYQLSLFHLVNHAFFKALLFLGAGAVIHSLSNEQDLRRMGGLRQLLPFTYSMLLIGSLALAGFPFLTGFYSKDIILEISYAHFSVNGLFAYWLGTFSAFLTAFYSTRLLYLVFLTDTNSYKFYIKHTHESSFLIAIPLMILATGSIFLGYLLKDLMIGAGSNFFFGAIFILPKNLILFDSEFTPIFIKLLPTILSFFGIISALVLYSQYKKQLIKFKISFYNLYSFLIRKWYFDYIYNYFFGENFLKNCYNYIYKSTDKGLIELLGPTGVTYSIYKLIRFQNKYQTGLIFQYTCLLFLSLIFFTILIEFFI